MFSIHGLLRYENPELGRDADTGGQTIYVLEEALELSKREEVKRVDLFTRCIRDKSVSEDYANPIERVNDKFRIVRIQCGGTRYMRKELLWPYLDEFVDKTVQFIKKEGRSPDIIHGHYADGGYVGMHLSRFFGTPFIFTGHSLGIDKKKKLLDEGLKEEVIDKKLKINHRIHIEETIIKNTNLVITSTKQEIKKQYNLYANNTIAKYSVIPPGINIDTFYPYYHNQVSSFTREEEGLQAQAFAMEDLNRFFIHPEKPLILSLCRPDKRKNISGLIHVFGEDKELQTIANLAIYAGIRKDILEKEETEKDVLIEMLLLLDKYDLYGKMAIPKKHDFLHMVPELYRIAAASGGVFVNAALNEPFGITLIEASSCGLPIVATKNGGPQDIVENCKNGILVDPNNRKEIAKAIKAIISDHDKWVNYSKSGRMQAKSIYTWQAHAQKYMSEITSLAAHIGKTGFRKRYASVPIGKRLTMLESFLFTDIDNTLIGNGNSRAIETLLKLLDTNRDKTGFGVATGRTIDSTLTILKEYDIPIPDIIISSVGAEIYYGEDLLLDTGWETHITNNWDREKIRNALSKFDFLEYQEEETQRKNKISYYLEDEKDRIAQIHHKLVKSKCRYNLLYSHGQFLDILPHRASKGKAIRYISYKWGVPLDKIVVSGDSGNDEEMLRGETLGVVVANYSNEMEKLKGLKNIYFSRKKFADGVIDGIVHYKFLEKTPC